jgi:hypothetical protein
MSMVVVHVASGSRHSSLLGRMAEAMGHVLATLYTRQLVSKRRDAELLELLSRGGMYTFLYPLDARHPDPLQSPLGSGILMG